MTNSFCHWRSQIRHNFSSMTNLWWKTVHHKSRVILELLWRFSQIIIEVAWFVTKTEHHRTILACVAEGLPRWWVLLLEMLSTLHAIAGCIGDGSGTCHRLIAQRGHLWFLHISGSFGFLLLHMLVFYGHTCRVAVGSRITSSLDHVAYFYWSMWPFLIRPRVTTLFVHVLNFYLATWLDDILPCVRFLIDRVSCSGYFTGHALVPPHVVFLFDHVACSGSTTWSTIN
jgi:hypothetical protein